MIKNIIIFSMGVVAGATASYIYAKNKYEQVAEEEIASMREYTNRRIEAYKNEAAKSNKMLEMIASVESSTKEEEMKDVGKIDYTSFTSNKKEDTKELYLEEYDEELEGDDDEFDEEYHKEEEFNNLNEGHLEKPPFIISSEEFGTLPVNDSRTLMYYTFDDVLATEEEEVISDIHEHLGDTLDEIGFVNDNNMPFYYVRNMPLNVDYEIVKVQSSFEESRVLT